MKKLTRIVCLSIVAVLLAGAVQDADAQIWKRAKERAKEKINERVERRTDEAVDEAVDKGEEGVESAVKGAVARMGEEKAAEQVEQYNLGANATGPVDAPQVQYRSATSFDLGGWLGAMARVARQDLSGDVETVTTSATHQRTDGNGVSTIIDTENKRFITLNHERKTYTEKSFEEMAAEVEAQMEQLKESAEEEQEGSNTDVELAFDVTTNRTGRTETVNGSSAEQALLLIRTDVTATDAETAEMAEGAFHTIVDLWMTEDLAGYETMQAFQKRMAASLGEQLAGNGDLSSMLTMMSRDPRLGSSMKKAVEEMQKMQGVPVRSTIYLVAAPKGAELDLELAMRPVPEAKGLSGLMKMAEEMSESQEVAEQVTLLSLTTQIADLQPNRDVAFEIPEGYTRVDGTQ